MLQGKKILLGVCGGIAAYKVAFLTRLLTKSGAEVRVIMTEDAVDFISPLTMATLSKNPVIQSFIKDQTSGTWENHVELGLWADLFVMAPATANTISKMAYGQCDNILLATYLSAKCPVMLAPAMDLDMYAHPSTQKNLSLLQGYGNMILEVGDGELASGLSGPGRMAEPEAIITKIETFFKKKSSLKGIKALVTAGPTYEPIDPVRFIGNHSSGKMGYAIAEELANRGAEVALVSGPVHLDLKNPRVQITKVQTAIEMLEASKKVSGEADIMIMAAAVADFRPDNPATEKIKKSSTNLPKITFEANPDIAATLGKSKKKNQILAGFALETENEEANALRKLKEKNLDLIVLNSLKEEGVRFGSESNKVTIYTRDNKKLKFELKNKKAVAADIVDAILGLKQ